MFALAVVLFHTKMKLYPHTGEANVTDTPQYKKFCVDGYYTWPTGPEYSVSE